ncbi:MAG TPA: isoprenylcysteine carboxylmethyltransferase family protein [Terriglobales bacterium]|jgi:protein-S-isoprenylcysteine O-methyltransferase Ste14|nr:isoprenylcysteine carboxylmethyltransferase family protein [Terriglobales bacterium]
MPETAHVAQEAAFYAVIVCWWVFCLTFWLRKRPPRAREAKRDRTSLIGMVLQGAAYFCVWFYPMQRKQFSLVASGSPAAEWGLAVLTVVIAGTSTWLVIAAARRLGKQWALAARLVEGHTLIQDGPYRFVRNPIYTGMFGMLLATGLAVTQRIPLLAAIVLFAVGTWIRIRSEERLLREAFGSQFEAYARKVPALIPGIY